MILTVRPGCNAKFDCRAKSDIPAGSDLWTTIANSNERLATIFCHLTDVCNDGPSQYTQTIQSLSRQKSAQVRAVLLPILHHASDISFSQRDDSGLEETQ